MGNGIGVRQRKVLDEMLRYGRGSFPESRYIPYATRTILRTLESRGLVELVDKTWSITDAGREAVTWEVVPVR